MILTESTWHLQYVLQHVEQCDNWGGAVRAAEFTWEGAGGKAGWETLTYCLSITKNYTL